MKLRGTWLCALVALTSCGSTDETDPTPPLPETPGEPESDKTDAPEGVTYHADIRPIIEDKCLGCHVEGGSGPFALDTYEAVEGLGSLVYSAVESGYMPPWRASDECHDLKDSLSLTAEQRALFGEWSEGGFAEGNEADYQPLPTRIALDLGEPDVLMQSAAAYLPDITIDDEYRCFITDGTFDTATFVTAMDIRPGATGQVHHVQVHQIAAASLPDAQALDDEAEGVGYPCTGGVGVASVNMFSWRPGSQAVAFEEGDAAYIEPGSAVVLQVHYNNQFIQPGEELEPDQSGVALWTLPAGDKPERVVIRYAHFGLVGPNDQEPLGLIAAGDPDVVGGLTLAMRNVSTVGGQYVQGEIIGMTPHMHTLGTRLAETLVRSNGESECMVDVPDWDFEWQMDYYFQTAATYGPDDQMDLVCEYDNSPANQPYLDGARIQPRDVTWGEGSLDEMCLNYVWLRFPQQDFFDALAGG